MNGGEGTATLRVERVVPGGDALARHEGVVVLVPGALPGDLVRARLEHSGRSLLRGEVVELLEAGPNRRPDAEVCPRARDGSCGGCDWPAALLSSHQALKTQLVLDALRRIGRVPAEAVPEVRWLGSPRRYRLRNRLHVDGLGRVGFFAPRSTDVSDLVECEVVSGTLLERLAALRAALAQFPAAEGELQTLEGLAGTPLLGELRLERGRADAAALADALLGPLDGVRVLAADGRPAASRGDTSLSLEVGQAAFTVSVSSFFQANRFLLEGFLGEVRSFLDECAGAGPLRRAVDLYAGVGFLARPLLERAALVEAVEVDASSSRDLAANLGAWREEGLPSGTPCRSTAEAYAASGGLEKADVVVADPPREGISPAVRRALLRAAPRHLVLVSCDPATLARDLLALSERYALSRVTLLDLFPGTHHVETLALLARAERPGSRPRE